MAGRKNGPQAHRRRSEQGEDSFTPDRAHTARPRAMAGDPRQESGARRARIPQPRKHFPRVHHGLRKSRRGPAEERVSPQLRELPTRHRQERRPRGLGNGEQPAQAVRELPGTRYRAGRAGLV